MGRRSSGLGASPPLSTSCAASAPAPNKTDRPAAKASFVMALSSRVRGSEGPVSEDYTAAHAARVVSGRTESVTD